MKHLRINPCFLLLRTIWSDLQFKNDFKNFPAKLQTVHYASNVFNFDLTNAIKIKWRAKAVNMAIFIDILSELEYHKKGHNQNVGYIRNVSSEMAHQKFKKVFSDLSIFFCR